MGTAKIIEWKDFSSDTVLYRVDLKNDVVKKGTALTVRESQAAVFCDKGRFADVFAPGAYKLNTDSLPLVTALLNWKYGFEQPFKSDIYFVNTKLFTDCKWGTPNPVILSDPQLGAVRVRAFGTYAFKVSDPRTFLTELSGTNADFYRQEITGYIKSILLMGVSDALGKINRPVAELTGNLIALSDTVKETLAGRFAAMGLELAAFHIESLSLPPELEKALDENARLSMLRGNVDVYAKLKQADALESVAKNNGALGVFAGAEIGKELGRELVKGMGEAAARESVAAKPQGAFCPHCRASVPQGAKFCGECGKPLPRVCPACGAALSEGVKFCGECGHKLG